MHMLLISAFTTDSVHKFNTKEQHYMIMSLASVLSLSWLTTGL